MQTIKATYDGRNLRRDEPLPLAPITRVTVTICADEPEPDEDQDVGVSTFLDVARSIKLNGPPGWSMRVKNPHYGWTEEELRAMGESVDDASR